MSLDPAELLRLKGDLRSDDAEVRADAVQRVAEVIDGTVMVVLSQALLSENPEVRQKALELLDRLADAGALDPDE